MLNKARAHQLEQAVKRMASVMVPFGTEAESTILAGDEEIPWIMIETTTFGSDELNDARKKARESGFDVVEWDVDPHSDDRVRVYFALADN